MSVALSPKSHVAEAIACVAKEKVVACPAACGVMKIVTVRGGRGGSGAGGLGGVGVGVGGVGGSGWTATGADRVGPFAIDAVTVTDPGAATNVAVPRPASLVVI